MQALRRFIGTLLVASLGALIPIADSVAEPVSARRAVARWRTGPDTFVVDVLSSDGSRGTSTIAGVGVTHCVRGTCIAALRIRRVPDRKVQIDPSLEQARATLRLFGTRVIARWRADDEADADARGAGSSSSIRRSAMARGGLLGRSLGGDGLVSARLMEMAWHPQQGRKGGDAPADPSVRMAGGCYTAHSSELSLIRSMNGARRARGMPRLRSDAQLAKVARKHTREMIDNGQPFHTAPPTLSRRVTRWLSLGENVGRGQTAVTLHRAFMGSPTHRANILNPRFRYVGVGTVQHDGRLWVTVNFERRRDPGTTLPPSC